MDMTANVLLVRGELAWCDVCAAEQLLMPTDDDSGLWCTVCDAAVFVVAHGPVEATLLVDPPVRERRSA